MVSLDKLANAIFGGHRAETLDVATDGATSTYVGVAVSDSEDGTVLVDLGGDVTLPDDLVDDDGTIIESYDGSGIEMPTGPNVRAGDTVMVTVVGGSALKSPMVTSAAGEGDRTNALAQLAKDVADAINQFFWHDSNGAHVTQVPQDEWDDPEGASYHSGPNALWNSAGMLFRDGVNNLLALVAGNIPGVAIYDGQGNGDENIVASFVGNLIELGRNGVNAVIKLCGGRGVIRYAYDQDLDRYVFRIDSDGDFDVTSRYEPDIGNHVGFAGLHIGGFEQSDSHYSTQAGISARESETALDRLHTARVYVKSGTSVDDAYGYDDASVVGLYGCNLEVADPKENPFGHVYKMRTLIEALKMVKTAGDSFSVSGLRAGGYITTNKTEFAFTIPTPFTFYDVTGVTLTGSYTIRQNGNYLFGSTASAGYAFQGHYSIVGINQGTGQIHVVISTGATQTSATNNDTAAIVLNTCTITLT